MHHEFQNLTIRLSRETIRKARVLAARRSTSISRLVAEHLDLLTGEDQAYERARREALALLDQGFPLGGRIAAGRDEWHAR